MDLSRRSLFRSAIAFTLFSGLGLAACRSGTSGNGTASSGGSGTATAGALALCNAPWGVTDLKAAVRYLHYNSASLPGAMDKMFVFGHSGGGAQSSVMGASGDSPLYTRYLECLGAAMTSSDGTTTSDAIVGVTAWCPITGLQGFVTSQKSPSKDVGAFDAPDRSATENIVMGKGTQGLHFSKLSRDVPAANESTYSSLTGWSGDYVASTWDSDFATTDEAGATRSPASGCTNPSTTCLIRGAGRAVHGWPRTGASGPASPRGMRPAPSGSTWRWPSRPSGTRRWTSRRCGGRATRWPNAPATAPPTSSPG